MEQSILIVSDSLRRVQEEGGRGNFVIFTSDEGKGYYIQFAAARGQTSFWAEAVSNDVLKPEFALDAERMERLKSLGWKGEPGRNFFRNDWQASNDEERTQIAEEVLRTFVEVYGYEPDQPLEVNLVLE